MDKYQKIRSLFESGELSQSLPNILTEPMLYDVHRHGVICYKVSMEEDGSIKHDYVPYEPRKFGELI